MRFNPLWLILLIFFLSGAWVFLLPLLVFFALFAGGALMLGLSGGFTRLPAQWWKILTDRRARADLALAHAVIKLLSPYGIYPTSVWTTKGGFFLGGVEQESAVYEASVHALAALKGGDRSLAVNQQSYIFKALAGTLVALVLMCVCVAALNVLGFLLACAAGWFAAPWLSALLQNLLLTNAPFADLTVQSARFSRRAVKSLGGRMTTVESGVEVSTSSYAAGTIEAEIVEE